MSMSETVTGTFAPLVRHEFAILTTYRASGEAVPTTIWFANDGDHKIYITTRRTAGKIRRVRNDGRVMLTPSDRVGNLLGEPAVAGQAREAAENERTHARATLATKYGDAFARIAGTDDDAQTYIVVEPAQQ